MKHIPNILSGLRIALIPIFVWLMVIDRTTAAAIVLAISGLTDLLDGFLARRFGWITQLGKVLDPVADKLTQVTVCVIMMIRLREYWPFFAVILLKDMVMLLLGGSLVRKGVKLEGSKWFGKVVTFLFYMLMTVLVFVPSLPEWVALTGLSVLTVCAVIAALLYIPDYRRYRRMEKAGEA